MRTWLRKQWPILPWQPLVLCVHIFIEAIAFVCSVFKMTEMFKSSNMVLSYNLHFSLIKIFWKEQICGCIQACGLVKTTCVVQVAYFRLLRRSAHAIVPWWGILGTLVWTRSVHKNARHSLPFYIHYLILLTSQTSQKSIYSSKINPMSNFSLI